MTFENVPSRERDSNVKFAPLVSGQRWRPVALDRIVIKVWGRLALFFVHEEAYQSGRAKASDSSRDRHATMGIEMPDELSERVRLNAAAVGIVLEPDDPARIARAITPTLARLEQERPVFPMEVEPSTFAVLQRGEIAK